MNKYDGNYVRYKENIDNIFKEKYKMATDNYIETKKQLDKYKNIVDEVLESVCCIEHNLDKYEEIGLDHLEYAQNKIAELKEYLRELKGDE